MYLISLTKKNTKVKKRNEPLMIPSIKSKKKNGRKEIKLHNLVTKPADESMMVDITDKYKMVN
jgi:hypothetical protein